MKIETDGGRVLIDEDTTRAFYKANSKHNNCECSGCRNFRACLPKLPDKVKAYFGSMGIDDMAVISEIMPLAADCDGMMLYGGFFHIVGELENIPSLPYEIPCYEYAVDENGNKTTVFAGKQTCYHTETSHRKLCDDFDIWFSGSIAMVPENFPAPTLQLEIYARLPWVLDEENTY